MHKIIIAFFSCVLITTSLHAQVPVDTLLHKLDSLSHKSDSAGFQINNTKASAYNDITKLSTRDYFVLLGSNIKQGFTKPFHMTHKDWGKFGRFALVAAATTVADESIQRNAMVLRENNVGLQKTGKFISRFGAIYEGYTLAAFGLYGVIFKDQKVKTTTLLATQACVTGGLLESVVKTFSGRTRPDYYPGYVEAEPSFKGPFAKTSKNYAGKRSNSSFPSGHATLAFAAATVFAKEYKTQPVLPIIAYTSATLISLSRITENKHWTSDILVGAALGFLTGRQVVNNYHRFAKLKNTPKKQGGIAVEMNYQFGRLMPGLVYHFG